VRSPKNEDKIVEKTSRLSALNYAFKEKDIFFPSLSAGPSIPGGAPAGQQVDTKGARLTFDNFYKLP
jgi:hypothetical protein